LLIEQAKLRHTAGCRATQIEEGFVMGNRTTAGRADLVVEGMNQGLRLVRLSLIICAALGAASCGGGGGEGEGGAPPLSGPSFDLAAGIASLSASNVNATMSVSGTLNGVDLTGSAQLTQSVATAATFSGGSALMQTMTVSAPVPTTTEPFPLLYSFVQYDSSAYATLGLDINISSVLQYAVADSPIEFPSSVRAGDTAVLGTMTIYQDAAMTMAEGTIQVSYLVIADPENTDSVIMEVIDKCFGNQGGGCNGQIFQFDYSLTATGSMSLQSLSITYPGATNIPGDMVLFTVQ
jgi:hypothetical protein